MPFDVQAVSVSRKMLWIGYIVSTLPVLLLLMSAAMKFMKPETAIEGFAHLGIPVNLARPLGILELPCTVVYVIPRTSIPCAIPLTGYFGGATCTTLPVGDAFFAPVIVGMFVWGGLFRREPWLRALIPLRR